MCPWVFLQERNRKNTGKHGCYSPEGSLGKGETLWRTQGCGAPKVFSVSLLQKNPRTHFDGNNTWDQTLFENKNAMREKKNHLLPKRKKSLIPLVIPVKMCPCVFSAEFQQKHLRGTTTMSSPAWVLGKEETPFWRPLFLSPAKLMKISFP